MESGFARSKKIVCTQPRKVACTSLTKRISEELNAAEHSMVTYKIGNEKFKKSNLEAKKKMRKDAFKYSKLIFMTDRILLNEYKRDKKLKNYSCIIVDEAHERNLFTDILLAELKHLVQERSKNKVPLKLIIMSATIDHQKFSKYLDNCPVILVPGQMYPVSINYEKLKRNYLDQTIDKIKYVIENKETNPGDILVFLTAYDEIQTAIKKTEKYLSQTNKGNCYVLLSLYGKMSSEEQDKIFATYENRTKIVFATNVAETSITIDGVRIIIDTGRVKERVYDQNRNISLLKLNLISQSSSTQRKGRAGRTSSGICYRLYEESDFNQMDPIATADIFKKHLGLVILQLLSCGINDPINYDLLDKPSIDSMKKSLDNLKDLDLVNSDGELTQYGKLASEMFIEPSVSRMIFEGVNFGIPYEITVVAAMVSISNSLFNRSSDSNDKNLIISELCEDYISYGDLICLLKIFFEYKMLKKYKDKINWCQIRQIVMGSLKLAEQTFDEIWSVVKNVKNEKNNFKLTYFSKFDLNSILISIALVYKKLSVL